jgi:YHS domain-containing protein
MRPALPLVAIALAALAASGCDQRPAAAQQKPLPVQTIEKAPPRLSVIDPPQTLEANTIPARPAIPAPTSTDPKAPPTPEEELAAKTNLPFSPSIAMDPVDGSKVSITLDTPVYSYKDRWYYFANAQNKAAFRANPEAYAKGALSTY